jgi:hypothetical protein
MKLSPAFTRCLAYGAIAAGGAGVVLALADVETPLRDPLALLALAGVPAVVITGWLESLDIFSRIVVAAAAAIALNALIAESMLELGTWSPRIVLVTVLLICAVGRVLQSGAVRDALIAHRWAPRSAQADGQERTV